MTSSLNLVTVLTVIVAAGCLWSIVPQSEGRALKLWRLAVPPFLAAVAAVVLLAGSHQSLALDAAWAAAAIVGAGAGTARGRTVPVETDQMWGLVRPQRTRDGVGAAILLLLLAVADFASPFLDPADAPAQRYLAVGAALCAGFLGGRGWTMGARAARASHVDLPHP